ncbi:MAG: glycosyltransferase family 4 protein [Caulobacterales bacterium]
MPVDDATTGNACGHSRSCVYFFSGSPFTRTDGCHIRALETLRVVAETYDRVWFQSFINHPLWPWTQAHIQELKNSHPNVTLELLQRGKTQVLVTRLKNLLVRILPKQAGAISKLTIANTAPDHIGADLFMNYADGFTQIPRTPSAARIFVDTHDVAHRAYAYEHGLPLDHPSVVARARKEWALTGLADDVIAISRSEADIFTAALPTKNIWLLPPIFDAQPQSGAPHNEGLLFVGSANDKNLRGIKEFIEEASGWSQKPNLTVAGKVGSMFSSAFIASHADFVRVQGYVAELSDLYRNATAALCPVRGTGLNIKILEALSFGVPVFADQIAIDALPLGYEGCVFPLTRANIEQYLASSETRESARQAALTYVASDTFRAPWRMAIESMRSAALGER